MSLTSTVIPIPLSIWPNGTVMLLVPFLLEITADIGSNWPFESLRNHPLKVVFSPCGNCGYEAVDLLIFERPSIEGEKHMWNSFVNFAMDLCKKRMWLLKLSVVAAAVGKYRERAGCLGLTVWFDAELLYDRSNYFGLNCDSLVPWKQDYHAFILFFACGNCRYWKQLALWIFEQPSLDSSQCSSLF